METLLNIWNTFKDYVVPVLITLSTTLLPVIYSMLSSKIKSVKAEDAAMAEAIGDNTKSVSENNAMRTEIATLSEENKQLQANIKTIAEMIYNVFMQSNLPEASKAKLSNMYALIVNEDTQKTLAAIQEEAAKWKEMYDKLLAEQAEAEKSSEAAVKEEPILEQTSGIVRS